MEAENRKKLILTLVWVGAALASWPILQHRSVFDPLKWPTNLGLAGGYIAGALLCYLFYRAESRRLSTSQALILALLIALLTCFVNQLHYFYIDTGTNWSSPTNTVWQERLQINVTNLLPAVAPHSYRFLPNGIVLWMEMGRIKFRVARDVYRLVFGLLLFYAIYRYARLYTDFLGGIFALLLVAVVYPMSFETYAGQLTDPMSHLSFVLAFIFLEAGDFAFLLSTLLIGSLAKETVLALSGYYVLFRRSDRHYIPKALTLCAASLAFYYGVRLWVLHGTMQYSQVSGVTADHILDNLRSAGWPMAILVLLGGYAVFLVLGWKETPLELKRMLFYITPVLLVSNLFFGWLRETRNYMPAVFILAVIAGRYISRRCAAPDVLGTAPVELQAKR